MKIGILTDAIDIQPAGIGVYVENLVENLLKIDRKNEYILIHQKKSEHPLYKKTQEIRYSSLSLFPRMIKDSLFLSSTKEKFDLVHKPNATAFLFPVKWHKVITIHDLAALHITSLSNPLHRTFYREAVKQSIQQADAIITPSEFTRRDVIDTFNILPQKVVTIYSGINPFFLQRENKNQNNFIKNYNLNHFILTVGTIEPRKNLVTLIKAFEIAKKRGIPHKLVIVGKKGWLWKDIIKRIERSSYLRDIVMTDYVSNNTLRSLYKNADCFVYPSLFEGFGFPVLEAMACGCPVITSNVSSLGEIAKNAAITFGPYDTEGYAREIIRIINDKNQRQNMISKGFLRAAEFSWEKTARQTLKLYKKVMENL